MVPPEARAALIRRRALAFCVLAALALTAALTRTDRLVRGQGRLGPQRWATIRSEAAGEVRVRLKGEGDLVRAGDPVFLLDGDADAVTVAELDLTQARQGLERASAMSHAIAEYSLCVPPPEVLDLAVWLEQQLHLGVPAADLAAGASARLGAIRPLVAQRARVLGDRRAAQHEGSRSDARRDALEDAVDRAGGRVVEAVRAAAEGGSAVALADAMESYEDGIFDGLAEVGGIPALSVRDPSGSRGQDPADGASQGQGYFELKMAYRLAQLALRRARAEVATLARLNASYPAIAGERRGELEKLRRLLDAFVARAEDSHVAWAPAHDRAEINGVARAYLAGVADAMEGLESGITPGLENLERAAAALRRRGPIDRVLARLLEVRGLVQQGLVVGAELESETAAAERRIGDFFETADALRLAAREVLGKRLADAELEMERERNSVEIARGQLREAMALGSEAAAAAARPETSTAGGAREPLAMSENDRLQLEAAGALFSGSVVKAEHALREARRAALAQTIHAPIDGVISSLRARERDLVSRNEPVGTIEDLRGLVFKCLVADKDFRRLALGQPAQLSIDVSGSRHASAGRVVWLSPAPGRLVEKETHPWNVLISVSGEDAALMPPQGGTAAIVVERPRGYERLVERLRPAQVERRPYLSPEVPDPTQAPREAAPPDPSVAVARAPAPEAHAARSAQPATVTAQDHLGGP